MLARFLRARAYNCKMHPDPFRTEPVIHRKLEKHFYKIPRRELEELRTPGLGDVGVRVRRDKKTKAPALMLWQTFQLIRLGPLQMKQLRDLIDEVLASNLTVKKKDGKLPAKSEKRKAKGKRRHESNAD